MRIIFPNLHMNGALVRTMEQMLTGKKPMTKEKFILEYFLKNNVEIVDFITPSGSFLQKITMHQLKSENLRKWEARYVLKKNGILRPNIQCIVDPSYIKTSDIVIYRSEHNIEQFDNVMEVSGLKIIDHLHFYGDREKAELLRNKGFQYYVYEVDLAKYSKLYQKNYGWFDGGFIMRPYSYEPRFKVKTPFKERKNKAVAMGTLTKCLYPEFIETYGTEYYQPHRKMIMDHAREYPKELDSYISEYEEKKLKEVKQGDSILVKTYKKLYNFFTSGKQKKYFSFDMVEKYNEYKMFICPEDVNGSYGIGTIEGMACGCAMIGLQYGAFEDMGMVAGTHYIPYDGTMDDLIEKIRYYQRPDHQRELTEIAKTGCKYVREKFSQENVAREYYEKLLKTVDAADA